jgi:fumarylpyruvate hydrolase
MTVAPVRVYTTPRNRLVLQTGGDLWDLSAFLERRGQPTDLIDLVEDGWFAAETLGKKLPGGESELEWTPAEVERDGSGAPLELGLPVPRGRVGKILALGKNFRAHAEEFGEQVPADPLYFNKLPEGLVPSGATVSPPAHYDQRFDHEAELCLVIGLGGRDIAEEDALEHVAGYTVANDLTLRSLQGADRKLGHPWFRAKNFDGALPLGPCFVPRDFLDPSAIQITCHVNGELRQEASTADWVVGLTRAVAHLSRHISLSPGDLILTGTPAGVGPLEDGDEVVCAATGIGRLTTRICRPTSSPA